MTTSVVCIHTMPHLIETFNLLGAEILPGVQFLHVLDEVMLKRVRKNGGADTREIEWLKFQVENAEEIQASAVLVTCTILSACVDEIRPAVNIPMIKIDEVLVERAVEIGEKIGVIVTNPDTLEPSTQLVLEHAAAVGKQMRVEPRVVDVAFDAVRNGDMQTHDRLVRQAINDLAPNVDVIILAQASMARVLDVEGGLDCPVPILSSPYLALEQLKSVLQEASSNTSR